MPQYLVKFVVVTDADDQEQAEQQAREIISSPNFEPVSISLLRDDEERG